MKRTRTVFALLLGLLLTAQCYATEWAFMGFDETTQKMYSVVRGDQGVNVVITLSQSNDGGWIGEESGVGEDPAEVIFESPISPDDPDRLIDIPDGELNVIYATVDFRDINDNYLYTEVWSDTLESNLDNDGNLYYIYRQEDCDWVLPDTIRIGTTFCATICHGSRSVPVFCEDPGYDPDLLEITVMNGCDPDNVVYFPPSPIGYSCNVECDTVDWSLFSWRKRVFPDCQIFLSMTYCGEGPGCVCIVRSDFYLPVGMNQDFRAIGGDGLVNVMWSTASESELTRFRVARSTEPNDGYVFVGSIPASNNATGHAYSFVDENVENGHTYYYKLHIEDANGVHVYNDGNHAYIASATPNSGLVATYSLAQNFPNPFNSQTSFSFNLPENDHVMLQVFDLLGREVATVVNRDLVAGAHTINWTAEGLATGVYVYKLTATGYSDTKKLLFLK